MTLDSKELLLNDLKSAFSLPITHISAYSLTIEKGTKFEGDFSKRKEDEDLEIFFIEKIKEKFPQYEISNFGKPSLHNLGYWEGNEYDGIGAGAVGFRKVPSSEFQIPSKNFRYYSQENVYEYLKDPIQYNYEYLTPEEIKKEKVFLHLFCCQVLFFCVNKSNFFRNHLWITEAFTIVIFKITLC